MRLQLKIVLILGCILFLSLHLSSAVATPSSESFDISIQPIFHFIEPDNTYEYSNIIQISSTTPGQQISVNWVTTSPFIEVQYENSIQLDAEGKATIGYSLVVEDSIPSGDYQIEYEISNQAGIAYGGFIPIRVYRADDADVVDIEIHAISPFNDIRYSQVELSVEYNGDWRVLSPTINYNHDLRLVAGEYRFTITDIITEVQVKDVKTISPADQDAIFEYTFPLIQFDLAKLSSTEIQFTITNFLGIQDASLVLKDANNDVIANYEFVISNGINDFSFPMPETATNELEVILTVNNYSQRFVIEMADPAGTSEDFTLPILGAATFLLIGSLKLILPRLPFFRKSGEESIELKDGNPATD